MNLRKVISACTASMLGLSYLCSAFTVSAAEKKDNLLVLGDASAKGYQNTKTIVEIIEKNLDVNYTNLSVESSTTADLLKSIKENEQIITEIKNSDQIVVSAGAYDYITEIMKVVGEYTDYDDSAEDVRNKMIDDLANSSEKIMAVSGKTTQAVKNINEAVKEIKNINPDVEVYLTTLYNPFEYGLDNSGVKNDPLLNAVAESFDTTIDTFNAAIYENEDAENFMDANKAFNKLAKKYANVSFEATGLSLKQQFDAASKVLAEITGTTPAAAVAMILRMIPANMLPLLPDNFNVSAMTFDISDAEYDLAKDEGFEVTVDIKLADNFGISAFQGDLNIAEGFTIKEVLSGDYAGAWAVSKKNNTIQFVSADAHNIDVKDGILGKVVLTFQNNIKPEDYEVSLSNMSISVLTSKGQRYFDERDNIIKTETGTVSIIDSKTPSVSETTPVAPETTPSVSETTPSGSDTTPVAPETTPTGSETTPSGSETTPSVSDTTPSVSDTTPSVSETTPSVSETTPVAPETTPSVSETTPVVPETTPSSSETTPAVTTTAPELPPVTGPTKVLDVPTGSEAQDMVSQVPYAQFYYSYDTNKFSLDGIKVEAQCYDTDGTPVDGKKIDITKYVQLKDKTATPKSTFDLASKKLIYAIPLELKSDKTENEKEYIYVETSDKTSEWFDITALKKAFDGVTFNAYIGLRGDINLDFNTNTIDASLAIKDYMAVSMGGTSKLGDNTKNYIEANKLTLSNDETKALTSFTLFLGDAANKGSDIANDKYIIDTRDATYMIRYYMTYSMATVEGKEFNESTFWSELDK